MPRKSSFKIILTNEEREHLISLARKYTAPYRDVIRAQVILMAAEEYGLPPVNYQHKRTDLSWKRNVAEIVSRVEEFLSTLPSDNRHAGFLEIILMRLRRNLPLNC